jgi:bacterial/archaeal transporter family-2 protein
VIVLLLLAAVAVGGALAIQVAMNTTMGTYAGGAAGATLLSFLTGALALALVMVVARSEWPSYRVVAGAPWWAWFGGVLGGVYVLVTVLLSNRLGPGPMFAAIVAGQMVTALVLEQFGWLGVPQHPVGVARAIGVAMLVGGVALIRWG